MKYKVITHVYGGDIAETSKTAYFETHTKASKYLTNMMESMENMGYYVRFSHYHEWGRKYKGFHRLNIDSFHVQMPNGRELGVSISEM